MKFCHLLVLICVFSATLNAQWDAERKLTDNDVDDKMPDVRYGAQLVNVTWICDDSVMFVQNSYDTSWHCWGIKTRKNPYDVINNKTPLIFEHMANDIIWQGQDSAGFGLYHAGISGTSKIIASADSIANPDMSYPGSIGELVWEQFDGNNWQIFTQSGDSTIALTDGYENRHPSLGCYGLVWEQFDGSEYKIMYRSLNEGIWDSVQRFSSSGDAKCPCITDNPFAMARMVAVWQKWDGNDWEICMRERNDAGIWIPETLLTDNDVDDEKPVVEYEWWGPVVVWQRFDGQDYEIMAKTRDTTWHPEVQLSDEDSLDDVNPRIGTCPVPLKDANLVPVVSVVWESDDGNDWEISYAFGIYRKVGVEENPYVEADYNLSLSPNPFSQQTIIKFEDSKIARLEDLKIRVYDVSGKLAEETDKTIIGKKLRPGIYFIKINNNKPLKITKIGSVR